LGLQLHEDPAVLAHIESFFTARKRPMPAGVRVQALVPEGALVLHNAHGTAPGLVIEVRRNGGKTLLVLLPGPPRELRPMFTQQVLPLIQRAFPLDAPFVCRTLRTTGLGESLVEEKIAGPLKPLIESGLELAFCGRPGEVDLRLLARGAAASQLVSDAESIVRSLLGERIFGTEEDDLERVVVRLLTERRQTLALAESCTGGLIANRITNVPGASAIFLGGIVCYSNDAKEKFLGVRAQTLAEHGAVSEATAREMAEGARLRTGAYYALSVTGIAGPTGGSEARPVGTVFVGLSMPHSTSARRYMNPYDRETFKWVTSQQALDWLRRELGA
jgi:nicotinamide-nucleotide amidase